jgi:hypothetical protein
MAPGGGRGARDFVPDRARGLGASRGASGARLAGAGVRWGLAGGPGRGGFVVACGGARVRPCASCEGAVRTAVRLPAAPAGRSQPPCPPSSPARRPAPPPTFSTAHVQKDSDLPYRLAVRPGWLGGRCRSAVACKAAGDGRAPGRARAMGGAGPGARACGRSVGGQGGAGRAGRAGRVGAAGRGGAPRAPPLEPGPVTGGAAAAAVRRRRARASGGQKVYDAGGGGRGGRYQTNRWHARGCVSARAGRPTGGSRGAAGGRRGGAGPPRARARPPRPGAGPGAGARAKGRENSRGGRGPRHSAGRAPVGNARYTAGAGGAPQPAAGEAQGKSLDNPARRGPAACRRLGGRPTSRT